MFEYYFHLASKWYGFKQAYVMPLVYKKKKHYWGKQSCVSYLGGYYYFPFLFNLWIIMLEYLMINQCQCCEVVVVVFIYSHPAYRVCWHKAFIYLYGCIWLVEYHTQRKRKTYTTRANQWIKLMLEVNSTGSPAIQLIHSIQLNKQPSCLL